MKGETYLSNPNKVIGVNTFEKFMKYLGLLCGFTMLDVLIDFDTYKSSKDCLENKNKKKRKHNFVSL